MAIRQFILIIVVLALTACSKTEQASTYEQGRLLDTGLRTVQSLDVETSGSSVHILVAGLRGDDSTHAHYLRSVDGGKTWSAPVQVDVDQPPPHKPARNIDPQIAANGQSVIAAWQIAGTGWGGFGPIATAVSGDGGASWQAGASPAAGEDSSEQGFIDLTADSQGRFHAVWLDKRDEQRGLRYASTANGGKDWSSNETIDGQTCECCWNRIEAQGESLYVAYRGKAPRDMHVAVNRGDQSGWSQNQQAGAFAWQFEGCPHAGAGMVIVPQENAHDRVHATVWTGKENAAGLYYVRSNDGGMNWQTPRKLGAAMAKHSDVAAQGNRIAAVWDGVGEKGSRIVLAQSTHQAAEFTEPELLHCEDQSAGSHPLIVSTEKGFLVTWTTGAGNLCAVTVR